MSNQEALGSTNEFGEKLKAWIKENYKSVKEFSRECDFKYFSTQNWITGHRQPSTDALIKLEGLGFKAFEAANRQTISLDQFAEGVKKAYKGKEEELFSMSSFKESSCDFRNHKFVKVMDLEASAGDGCLVYSEDSDEDFAFNLRYLRAKGLANANLSVVRVKGNSMEPSLSDGEYILVQLDAPPIDGKIFLIRSENKIFVKRLRIMKTGWLALSDNPSFPPIELEEESAILGRTVAAMRDL